MITFLAIVIILQRGNSVVVFDCLDELCINESVQYQCTTNDSNVLRWRIRNENMTELDTELYSNGDNPNGSFTPINDVPHFTTALLSLSPLISNISFIVQSSINGYTINCEDGDNIVNSCPVKIYDSFPPPPINVTIATNKTKIEVQWTPPNITSQCVTVSSYSITSNATNSIITTTDTSVDIPLAGLSPGVYCVSVATIDTANRTGEYSNAKECVSLKVPPCATVTSEFCNHSEESTLSICQLHWEFTPSPVPPLQWVYIYINVTGNTVRVSGNLESEQITIMRGQHYMFSVFGENVIGNGTTCDSSKVTAYVKEFLTTSPTTATTSSYTTATAVECATTCLSSSVSAGISVAIAVPVTAVITAIITVIILYLCGYKKVNKSSKATHSLISTTNEVEMKGNTAYGQVHNTTDTVNRPTLYEELNM